MEVTKKTTVLIVDDEPAARESIRTLLLQRSEASVIGICGNGKEAVQMILSERPAIVFLDIQMPQMDGFKVINQVREKFLPVFVFVTAFDRYALQAFEESACDYLLKPYDDERFYRSYDKALEQHSARNLREQMSMLLAKLNTGTAGGGAHSKPLIVKQQGRTYVMALDDVLYLESEGNFVKVFTANGFRIANQTMKSMEGVLAGHNFARIHKSFMVNVNAIKSVQSLDHGDYALVLKGGQRLKMSRNYKDSLRTLIYTTP